MSQKTILFDLDGTLTDSGEGIMKCALLALNHFGIEVPDFNALRVFVGPPLHEMFMKFGIPEEKANEAIAVYRSRYLVEGKFENFPYPGIRELLEKLKSQGHKLLVATSKPETTSKEILEHFDLTDYFDMICGASFDKSRSTKSQVIAYLLEQNGPDAEYVMIGDTVYDVIGANAHHIPTIGVAWGYGNHQDMLDAGAVAIANSTDELYAMLNR
jgi:phosphoglycolate phosphatase